MDKRPNFEWTSITWAEHDRLVKRKVEYGHEDKKGSK